MRLWIFTGILFTLLLDLSAGYPAGEEHGSSELLAITLKLPDCAVSACVSIQRSRSDSIDLAELPLHLGLEVEMQPERLVRLDVHLHR